MSRKSLWIFLGCALISLLWKGFIVFTQRVPFNADEAIVALMAKHILQGERPIFFYGQSYMGSLDAYLIAAGFALLGQHIWVIRLVQGLLYLGFLYTLYLLGKDAFDHEKIGLWAVALSAIPVVNMTLYTTITLGGYGEALLIGNLILLSALRLEKSDSGILVWSLGFWMGLGVWCNAITLVYSLPAGLFVLYQWLKRRDLLFLVEKGALTLFGGVVGALPLWIYASQHGFFSLLSDLVGSPTVSEPYPWIVRVGFHLSWLLLIALPAALGFRPPWSVEWLVPAFIPLALVAWLAVFLWVYRQLSQPSAHRPRWWLITGVGWTLIFAYLFTQFSKDPTGRYFLPMSVPLVLGAAHFFEKAPLPKWARVTVFVSLLVYFFAGNLACALENPPGFTSQLDASTRINRKHDAELIRFLTEQGETRGYTHYWVAYPLAFESDETLIFIPSLPYHLNLSYTPRDNRYEPYNCLVNESDRVAYITTQQTERLNEIIRQQFTERGVTWKEKLIGDYLVFYNLSEKIVPNQLNIQELAEP
jgi:4-amino-4-deoxy-L-arabinose transferase-like glycosyltransferase